MKTPVTKERLKQHWTYARWQYIALVIAAVIGWNLIYTMTAYRPPDEKKVEMYILAVPANAVDQSLPSGQELLNEYMEHVRTEEMPDMELMDSVFLTTDSTYAAMQLSTYMAAGEGDVYVLDNESFTSYAKIEAFMPLENDPELMDILDKYGINAEKGWRTNNENGEYHLYGIPCKNIPALGRFYIRPDKTFLSISINNGNDENSMKFLKILLEDALDGTIPTVENVQQ